MESHSNLNTIVAALESTSVYSIHIANFLSSCEVLMPYKPYVFCLNPKATANYRKSYIAMEKSDPMDAYLIADFARCGRTKKCEPWRGGRFLAFNNHYGAASSAVLTEFMSLQEIIDAPEEDLLQFLAQKSRNRISDITKTSELLKKAARDSYRLDKCMYEPLSVSLASSFNCIQTYHKEIKLVDQAIGKCINGMNPNAFTILKSIPGIGPVWAAGILSEIGDINAFHSSDALAKYAGLIWLKNDSGDFVSEDSRVCKAGNTYLRYYLGEAANSVRRHIPEYKEFYSKKYAEVTKHQHKRALALTSRKLAKNQLYTGEKLDAEFNSE